MAAALTRVIAASPQPPQFVRGSTCAVHARSIEEEAAAFQRCVVQLHISAQQFLLMPSFPRRKFLYGDDRYPSNEGALHLTYFSDICIHQINVFAKVIDARYYQIGEDACSP